jgi:hypothetical protein
MTDEVKTAAAAVDSKPAAEAPAAAAAAAPDPALEKAIANGYVEPPVPTRDERVKALLADVEHAMNSNAPMAPAMLAEMRALLA